MTAACALQYATQGIEVTVIADDTDILILLMYHARWDGKCWNQIVIITFWKEKDVVDKIGEALSLHILFIHAWSGCDTTSVPRK